MTVPDFHALMKQSQRDSEGGEVSSVPDFHSLMKSRAKPGEKPGRLAMQYGIGLVQRAALPYDIAVSPLSSEKAQHAELRKHTFEEIERLMEQKQAGAWSSQDEALLKELTAQIQHPERMAPHVRTADISSSDLIEKGAEKAGVDLKPQGLEEEGARLAGNIFSPKGIVGAVKRYGTKAGREAAKWANLERVAKGSAEKGNILNYAKAKNLNPQEATLLMQSKGDIDILGKVAKKTKRFKNIISGLRNKLNLSYNEIKEAGRKGGYVSVQESEKLTDDLGKILKDIGKTYVEGPDTKSAKAVIEDAIKNINNQPGTIEELINSRRNVRQSVNWNNVDEGDAIRGRAEKAFFDAIENKNPAIAKQLKDTDKAWAQYKKYQKIIEKEKPLLTIKGIPIHGPGLLSTLLFAGAGLTTGLAGIAKTYATKEVIQRVATRLLTDPKFQGIHKKLWSALKSGSEKEQKGLMTSLFKILKKEDPEMYQEFTDSLSESSE